MVEPEVAGHFETMETQGHAARLGMWIFLATEVLLFAGLFTLYAGYRAHYPGEFHEGIEHNTRTLGSINTGVLLASSFFVAMSVHALRGRATGVAAALLTATIVCGGIFLWIKLTEYSHHFDEGIYPGGSGAFFAEHGTRGSASFWTLYFCMTGLHAIHVCAGMLVLFAMTIGVVRGKIMAAKAHPLEIGAIYWHLIDTIWLFLWPIFYLA